MRCPISRSLCFLLPAFLAGACGQIDYDALPGKGRFTGSVLVVWVEENTTSSGDGKFVYVPFPGRELTFTRDVSQNPGATMSVIRPTPIYTDGGSVPRLVQPLKGFSPWGYAPAYMIHDWLFAAKRCSGDPEATPDERKVGGMPFIESAEIMGEAIKALIDQKMVEPNDVAPFAITSAVAGRISKDLWEDGQACKRLSDEHKALVDAFIGGRGATLRAQGVRPADRAGDKIRIVGVVEF